MSNGIVKKEEAFPTAQVPGATTLDEVFDAWQEVGLEAVEISASDLLQRIYITHDALTGKLDWKTEKMDGVQALSVLTTTMLSMFEYFIKEQPRPKFSSGEAKVAIYLKDNQLTVGLSPKYDPTVIKGIVAAALWELIVRDRGMYPEKDWLDLFVINKDD